MNLERFLVVLIGIAIPMIVLTVLLVRRVMRLRRAGQASSANLDVGRRK